MSVRGQLKLVVARYGIPLAVGLAVVGAVAFGGAYTTYSNPPVEEITEETNQQSFNTSVQTVAVVQNENALYEKGQELRDQPVYFLNATPVLSMNIRTAVPSDQEVSVTHRLVLELRGVREGQSFYEERRVIAAAEAQVSDGDVWTNTSVNMSAIREQVIEKRNPIGTVGTLEVSVRLQTAYESEQYSGTLEPSTGLVFSERAYWLSGQLSASESHSTQVTRQVTGSPNMGVVWGLSGAGIVLLAGAGLITIWSRNLSVESIETEVVRSQYDEWISKGEIPTKSDKDYLKTDSLEDLVDVAIDMSSRVIHDQQLDAYAVVQGDVVYYYTPDDTGVDDWLEV